jgi:hypothetical protein
MLKGKKIFSYNWFLSKQQIYEKMTKSPFECFINLCTQNKEYFS